MFEICIVRLGARIMETAYIGLCLRECSMHKKGIVLRLGIYVVFGLGIILAILTNIKKTERRTAGSFSSFKN